jgi:hypothetical protein
MSIIANIYRLHKYLISNIEWNMEICIKTAWKNPLFNHFDRFENLTPIWEFEKGHRSEVQMSVTKKWDMYLKIERRSESYIFTPVHHTIIHFFITSINILSQAIIISNNKKTKNIIHSLKTMLKINNKIIISQYPELNM